MFKLAPGWLRPCREPGQDSETWDRILWWGVWPLPHTVQTGKQVSQQSACGPEVTATPRPECWAARAVIHTALFWMWKQETMFLGMAFGRKQDVTSLCALLRNPNPVTSLTPILLAPFEMGTPDVTWASLQHLCAYMVKERCPGGLSALMARLPGTLPLGSWLPTPGAGE